MTEVPRRTSLAPFELPRFVLCLIGVETEGILVRIPIRPPTPTSADFPSDSGCGRSGSLLRKPGFP